ncbi:uncharacterized protein LOC130265800 [Oenanthe melanoleuca]|uniref:uncharacterized protein LOC130265800 n=1 Tax=Oenanthe melanoleuca TaxID=2939378 RepID=UPI0024C18B3C|nr:uncharacterized protein LOC130265800 [Oenanthe melanoleuca]
MSWNKVRGETEAQTGANPRPTIPPGPPSPSPGLFRVHFEAVALAHFLLWRFRSSLKPRRGNSLPQICCCSNFGRRHSQLDITAASGRASTVLSRVIPAPLPCPGAMDMQQVLLQLWGEVARLQQLCSEQARLLRSLRARKGPVLDIPVSLPVQCTEDVPGDGQRSPESRQKHPGALTPPTSPPEGSACPVGQPRDTKRLLPSPGSGAGARGAAALGSAERDEPTRRSRWILPVPWGGRRAPGSPGEPETPSPGAGGSSPNPLDLLEVPEKEDAGGDVALVEIRGPVKSCWSPGWALEEGAQGADPACDLCREILPAGPAAHTEYPSHVLAQLE